MEIEVENNRATFMRCEQTGDVFDYDERTLSASLYDSVEEAAYAIWNNGACAEFDYQYDTAYESATENYIGDLYGEARGSCVQSVYRIVTGDETIRRAIFDAIKGLK